MNRIRANIIVVFFITLLSIWNISGSCLAVENIQAWDKQAEKQLAQWQKSFEQWQQKPPTLAELEQRQNEIFTLKQKADDCIIDNNDKINSIQEKLEALGGTAADGESKDIKQRRKILNIDKVGFESKLAVCRLLSLGTKELQENQKSIRNKIVSIALTHRGKPVWDMIIEALQTKRFLNDQMQLSFILWPSLIIATLIFLVMFPLSLHFSRILKKNTDTNSEQQNTKYLTLKLMIANRLPWLAIIGSLSILAKLGGAQLSSALLLALLLSIFLAPLLHQLVCQQSSICKEGLPVRILLDILLIGMMMKYAGLESIMNPEAYLIVKAIFYLVLMFVSLWIMVALSRHEAFRKQNSLRLTLAMAIISGPIAMWFGYHAFASTLVPGFYGTLVSLFLAWVLLKFGNWLFDQLDPNDINDNTSLREFLGYSKQEKIPGVWVGRLLIFIVIFASFAYCLLLSWDIPQSEINQVTAYFTDGFPIGAITIVPSKLVTAILAFFVLLTFARWLRNQLSDRWLQHTKLDTGARESIVSLSSYTIIGLAIAIALGMAGVDFQNIAIVAGALSVGIGFGLQNIVNNFVSGLILLFERPVKPGDWVVVGSTEGYVKKISIRYTLIQTFDRADVLVPNSELISSQVTNWMLRDSMGRVIVPVGVAYGTEVRKVEKILTKIALEHPAVIYNDWRVSEPKVIFMRFGDSSLDFELRCFINNIDNRMSVRSDLLFAIEEKFREENIEIPFPQRVIHIEKSDSMSPGSESI
ncbi:MAG: mechanosensitive ion channel [Gammaproteobacteria bacterium]|nr:mechanosensitive ion channel [Gammaproteobacteria bacterium]